MAFPTIPKRTKNVLAAAPVVVCEFGSHLADVGISAYSRDLVEASWKI